MFYCKTVALARVYPLFEAAKTYFFTHYQIAITCMLVRTEFSSKGQCAIHCHCFILPKSGALSRFDNNNIEFFGSISILNFF